MSASITGYLASQSASAGASANAAAQSDASGSSADLQSGVASLSSSYQTFLTLLTTQLQNQDPSSPMDPNQFTTELVQMTGVQQQLLSNQLLQQLVNASPSNGVSGAVGLIGQTVTATSAAANLSGGQASWTYNLPAAAASATVSVTNAAGQVVYTGTAPSFAQGNDTFTWNGQTNAGVQLPDGTYSLSVAAQDANGGTITPTVAVTGTVSSVQEVGGTTMVTIGATQAPISSITKVGGS